MDELRVPKRRVEAEVVLPGGEVRRVTLFLAEAAPGHAGPERPLDLLNGAAEFFPALDGAAGGTAFLNRRSVPVVRVERRFDAPDDEVTLPTEHDVEVQLLDGSRLTGLVSYVRPPERSRLGDFLNEPPPFFRLLLEDRVAYVNKRHVVRVALRPR
jgi:hypothetical protein